MRSDSKHTTEELKKFINLYLKDGIGYTESKNKHDLLLSKTKFRFKTLKYKVHGIDGITFSKTKIILTVKNLNTP